MVDPIDLEDERYIRYADLLDQLHRQFPTVPRDRVARVIAAENDAITGGFLVVVPAEVAAGAIEMLERDAALGAHDTEVVA